MNGASPDLGILLLDKPSGPTSHDAVAMVRRALGMRRVGHLGTLDPFATGLLVCAVGRATRLAQFAAEHGRTYRAEVRLGWRSATDDPEGELRPEAVEAWPEVEDVVRACAAWVGIHDQRPPAFSAKRIGGERAYARARAGEAVALPASRVRIDAIRVERYEWPQIDMVVECGPGTYIRALARDIGDSLGTGGYCSVLRRERAGPFHVSQALKWVDLQEPDRVRAALQPADSLVASLPVVELDDRGEDLVRQGRSLPYTGDQSARDRWIRLRGPGGFLGIGEIQAGSVIQPRRILR